MDIIRRLATSQARGDKQLSLVNELLSFREVYAQVVPVPGQPYNTTVLFGLTKLRYDSWKNLKKRLIAVGFVFDINWNQGTVKMHFPEANL